MVVPLRPECAAAQPRLDVAPDVAWRLAAALRWNGAEWAVPVETPSGAAVRRAELWKVRFELEAGGPKANDGDAWVLLTVDEARTWSSDRRQQRP